MQELIKLWKQFQEDKQECDCGSKELSEHNMIGYHKYTCPRFPSVKTDIGVFLDWLSKYN